MSDAEPIDPPVPVPDIPGASGEDVPADAQGLPDARTYHWASA
jgi:hypothetical protein